MVVLSGWYLMERVPDCRMGRSEEQLDVFLSRLDNTPSVHVITLTRYACVFVCSCVCVCVFLFLVLVCARTCGRCLGHDRACVRIYMDGVTGLVCVSGVSVCRSSSG